MNYISNKKNMLQYYAPYSVNLLQERQSISLTFGILYINFSHQDFMIGPDGPLSTMRYHMLTTKGQINVHF